MSPSIFPRISIRNNRISNSAVHFLWRSKYQCHVPRVGDLIGDVPISSRVPLHVHSPYCVAPEGSGNDTNLFQALYMRSITCCSRSHPLCIQLAFAPVDSCPQVSPGQPEAGDSGEIVLRQYGIWVEKSHYYIACTAHCIARMYVFSVTGEGCPGGAGGYPGKIVYMC